MPSHRKQCVRYNEPGHAHELTFSCYQQLPLLSRDRTRAWLAEAIQLARVRLQFDLCAYVFMPEHVHLLIHPRQPDYRISTILWAIKRPVARRAILFLSQNSPEWLARLTGHGPPGHRLHPQQPSSPRSSGHAREVVVVECRLLCWPAAGEDRDRQQPGRDHWRLISAGSHGFRRNPWHPAPPAVAPRRR